MSNSWSRTLDRNAAHALAEVEFTLKAPSTRRYFDRVPKAEGLKVSPLNSSLRASAGDLARWNFKCLLRSIPLPTARSSNCAHGLRGSFNKGDEPAPVPVSGWWDRGAGAMAGAAPS